MSDDALIINYEAGLKVFMNSRDLYISCLLKFLDDKSFEKLGIALCEKKYDSAYDEAHTLKGLSGNLRLEQLYIKSSYLVELLKNKNYYNINKYYEELRDCYQLTIKYILNYKL